MQLGPRVSGYGPTSWSTVTRWNSEGAKWAKNSRSDSGGEGSGARRGTSREGTSRGYGRRPVDRSSGLWTDGRKDRQETGDRSLREAHARRMRRLWSLRYNKYRIGDRRVSERGMCGVREEKGVEKRKGRVRSTRGWESEGKPMNARDPGPTTMPDNVVTTSS